MKLKLTNFVVFQAGWFTCVLGAAYGLPWLGLLAAGTAVLLHLAAASRPLQEIRLMLIALLMGLIFDSLLLGSGWLRYPNGIFIPGVAPYWILAMWVLFATTLNVSLDWLKDRKLLAAALGAVFGPLSYMAGGRLGGLTFFDMGAAIIALALIWTIAMPLLVIAAGRHDGFRQTETLPLQGLTEEA